MESLLDRKHTLDATNKNLWLSYSKEETTFRIWSPEADCVNILLYEKGDEGVPFETQFMLKNANGIWTKTLKGNLNGVYYTYRINFKSKWLKETPGIYAKATGVNGQRAMILDLKSTNPKGWNKDKSPGIKYMNEAIIYELHIRDMTINPESGSSYPGKYKGLTEANTTGPKGIKTGIDHLKELGITHVHLLPTFDYYTIDETKLDSPQYNWGYDPQNYNVPEGSFSENPYKGAVRIIEFKEMIKAFHDNEIGVILDVVYNHTGITENSNFNLEYPHYYYRKWENGKLSNASACGNETASEKSMMRKFMMESLEYWVNEYHIDGFRIDLMGIHDIETMNLAVQKLKNINPNIFIYGEGWTAGESPLPIEKRALKRHLSQMPQLAVFNDELRDGLKGSVFEHISTGFVSGAKNKVESIKFGIVGAIKHPQIKFTTTGSPKTPWAISPWQSISYTSCHDNHTLYDKLKISNKNIYKKTLIKMHKLANAIVLTSQGVAFLHAGVDLLRSKYGQHNSYNLSDKINQIVWKNKSEYQEVFLYYKNLISLRKKHPAFWMSNAKMVQQHLIFKTQEHNLLSYEIVNHANNDEWKNILVVYNANTTVIKYPLKGNWNIALKGDLFMQSKTVKNLIKIAPLSTLILFQKK